MAMFIILKTDNFNFGFFLKVSCAFLLLENMSYQNLTILNLDNYDIFHIIV